MLFAVRGLFFAEKEYIKCLIVRNEVVQVLLAWGEKPSSKYVTKTQAKKIIANSEKVSLNLGKEGKANVIEQFWALC